MRRRTRDPTGAERLDRPIGRRRFLSGTALAGTAALAGCIGGSDPGPSDPGTVTPAATALPPPVLGDPEGSVTVAVYEDFSCPHCATFNDEVFAPLREAYLEPGTVRYEHHDFPIPVDDWSWPVASAARAVQDHVGDAAFFDYAERLFDALGNYSLDRLASLAAAVGAPPDAVREAAAGETYRPVVVADREGGAERGVSGTPTAFVNDAKLTAPAYEELREAIEAAR